MAEIPVAELAPSPIDLLPRPPHSERLGNPDMPVYQHADKILTALEKHRCLVLTSPTGSGKSTQIPQLAFDAGFDRVIATQPRIVAARSVSERVADEIAAKWGDDARQLVGYRTADEGNSTPRTRIEFCTDGLEARRLPARSDPDERLLLIVDEAHEANINMEALLLESRQLMAENPNLYLIVMSASIDAKPFADYLSSDGKRHVPIIEVPGRMYDVEERDGGMVVDEAVAAVKQGLNTQIFVPGTQDIEQVIAGLQKEVGQAAVILPLYGDQTIAEQERIFAHYDRPMVVVSTSIGQTSLTVPNLDVVIDSCLENTGRTDSQGAEGLYMLLASRSAREQRRGRVGRTKPGSYIRAHLEGYPLYLPHELDAQEDVPPIQCTRTDGLYLVMGALGINMAEATFVHNPKPEQIAAARNRLARIGAVALSSGELTDVGKHMAQLPLDSGPARMLVAAMEKGPKIAVQMAAASAILQTKGIVGRSETSAGWLRYTRETRSDILAELDVLIAAQRLSDDELKRRGIVSRRLHKALQLFQRLCDQERLDSSQLSAPTDEERSTLVGCIAAGTDGMMVQTDFEVYADRHGRRRKLQKQSIVAPGLKLLLGGRFDKHTLNGNGGTRKHYIVGGTAIRSADELIDSAAERVNYVPHGFRFTDGVAHALHMVHFDGADTGLVVSEPAKGLRDLHEFLVDTVLRQPFAAGDLPTECVRLRRTINEIQTLQHKSLQDLGVDKIISKIVARTIASIPEGPTTLEEIAEHIPEFHIEQYISPKIIEHVRRHAPDAVMVAGNVAPVHYPGHRTAIITAPRTSWDLLPTRLSGLEGWRVLVRHDHDPTAHTYEQARIIGAAHPRRIRRSRRQQPAPKHWVTLPTAQPVIFSGIYNSSRIA